MFESCLENDGKPKVFKFWLKFEIWPRLLKHGEPETFWTSFWGWLGWRNVLLGGCQRICGVDPLWWCGDSQLGQTDLQNEKTPPGWGMRTPEGPWRLEVGDDLREVPRYQNLATFVAFWKQNGRSLTSWSSMIILQLRIRPGCGKKYRLLQRFVHPLNLWLLVCRSLWRTRGKDSFRNDVLPRLLGSTVILSGKRWFAHDGPLLYSPSVASLDEATWGCAKLLLILDVNCNQKFRWSHAHPRWWFLDPDFSQS